MLALPAEEVGAVLHHFLRNERTLKVGAGACMKWGTATLWSSSFQAQHDPRTMQCKSICAPYTHHRAFGHST